MPQRPAEPRQRPPAPVGTPEPSDAATGLRSASWLRASDFPTPDAYLEAMIARYRRQGRLPL